MMENEDPSMASATDKNQILALGRLRGMLAVFAWANTKCDHGCTFTVEELQTHSDVLESLRLHFGESVSKISAIELDNGHHAVTEALYRWLFMFSDLVKPEEVCALTDKRSQQEIAGAVLNVFIAAIRPQVVWRVEIELTRFYECAWDDFVILGTSGMFLLHFGVSD
jgi:hypothetical protein